MNQNIFPRQLVQLALLFLLVAWAVQSSAAATGDRQDGTPAASAMPVYKPPLRGAPAARIGGATRGSGARQATVQVLAPDQVGFTTRSRPVLYWYVENPAAARVEFTLIDDEAIDPLLEVALENDVAAGIQRIDLAERAVELQPGVAYQWSVALVTDGSSRSGDIVSGGAVELTEPDAALAQRLAAVGGTEQVALLAGAGIWYDALDALAGMIVRAPRDSTLVAMRTALLDQVGLQLPQAAR